MNRRCLRGLMPYNKAEASEQQLQEKPTVMFPTKHPGGDAGVNPFVFRCYAGFGKARTALDRDNSNV